jgi:hypothetical protein
MSTKKAQTKKMKYKEHVKVLDEKEKRRLLTLSAVLNTISSLSKMHGVQPTPMPASLAMPMPFQQQPSNYNIPEKMWARDYEYMTFDPPKKEPTILALKSPQKNPHVLLSKKNPLKIKKGLTKGRGGKKKKKTTRKVNK